jgi:hypothetical protein
VPTWLQSLLAGGLGATITAFLFKTWIEARLVASITHEYNQLLERFKKVELVAELFAEWVAVPHGEPVPKEHRTRMNQLSFAASIWLPSAIVIEMSKTLQLKPDAKSPFEVLLLARKELLGDQSLMAEHITWWRAELEKRGDAVVQRGV